MSLMYRLHIRIERKMYPFGSMHKGATAEENFASDGISIITFCFMFVSHS